MLREFRDDYLQLCRELRADRFWFELVVVILSLPLFFVAWLLSYLTDDAR